MLISHGMVGAAIIACLMRAFKKTAADERRDDE